jgi:hypothetical protein
MRWMGAWAVVGLGIGLAAAGCEDAGDKAIEAAQQGQMVSMGPGGQAGAQNTMVSGEAELTPEGFLEVDGHRCVLVRVKADLEHADSQQELQPGMAGKIRTALRAEGWSLFDTVDRTVRKAELAVYLGMRTLIPVTPQMRGQLCKKVNKRIPDEIHMQVDADNFVTIALQPAD